MTITGVQAIEALAKTVTKYGADTRYTQRDGEYHSRTSACRYLNDKGEPMCLVGVALIEELGVDPESLAGHNNGRAISDVDSVDMDDVAVDVLGAAQASQDAGATWGDAYAESLKTLNPFLED